MSDVKEIKETKEAQELPDELKKLINSVSEEVQQAPPATVYAAIMASMTPETLANLGVKLVSVNGEELFWMTSVGQLYVFNNRRAALQAEYDWLMSEPKK